MLRTLCEVPHGDLAISDTAGVSVPHSRSLHISWVLHGHPHHELSNCRRGPRSSWPAIGYSVVLGGNELAVPGQQRIGRDDAGEATQGGSAKNLGPDRESAPLVVRQPNPSLAELLPQDPVLLAEVLDDVLLPVIDPAGNSEDEEVQHQGIHTTTLAAMPHREHRPRGPRKNAAGSAGSGCVGFRHSTWSKGTTGGR
jgi:hypothetical protein